MEKRVQNLSGKIGFHEQSEHHFTLLFCRRFLLEREK